MMTLPHRLINAPRPPASLDSALVVATWWVITRSMVGHALALTVLIVFFTPPEVDERSPSYQLILHWIPLWLWGALLAGPALVWLFTHGWICIVSGICIAAWFFSFATAFFVAWTTLPNPGTTPTGWATYGFLGWAWLCVTYVVWKDEEHVRRELAQLRELDVTLHLLEERGGHRPE